MSKFRVSVVKAIVQFDRAARRREALRSAQRDRTIGGRRSRGFASYRQQVMKKSDAF
jgi:hypothetical protein